MAREQYIPCAATMVSATSPKSVRGERIDEQFSPLKPGHIPELTVVVKSHRWAPNSPLRRISSNHGRSYELQTSEREPGILFADKYGNVYTSINLKGNNLARPWLELNSSLPGNIKVQGLQQDDAIGRVIRASRLLRASHVDTEWILKAIVPQELPLNGRTVTIPEFKDKVGSWDEMPKVRQAFKKTRPVITVRAMTTGIRVEDLCDGDAYVGKALQTVNTIRALRGETSMGVDDYLANYLPQNLGRNLGTLHRLGLFHNYLTTHNITATGGIVDLDSVQGWPLGDAKTTQRNMESDVNDAISTLTHLTYIKSHTVSSGEIDTTFFANYMLARGWNPRHISGHNNIRLLLRKTSSYTNKNRVLIHAKQILTVQAQESHK